MAAKDRCSAVGVRGAGIAMAKAAAEGAGCPAFILAASIAGEAGESAGLPRDLGVGPALVVVGSDRLGDGDGFVEAPDGVSILFAIPAASVTGGPGAAALRHSLRSGRLRV